jgi:YidC/Oxa1 family membrane protein insertase
VPAEEMLLKYVVRWTVVCAVITLLIPFQVAYAQGPSGPAAVGTADSLPDPRYNQDFAQADRLIKEQVPEKAYDEYIRVKNESEPTNPALAADALLRAALLGYDILKNGEAPDFKSLPAEAQEARHDKETDLARKSHEVLKTIRDDPRLADTQVGGYVLQPHWINISTGLQTDLRTALESQIDNRNSRLLSYQVVDKLVRITGAIPSFSYWFALILIAVVVKAITFPLTLRTYKSQRELQKVQPLMKEMQEKYKNDKQQLNEKMIEFYKEHKINPFASCIPMIVQLPFMYFVYNTIRLYEYHFANGKFLWIGSGLSHQFPMYIATDLAKFDVPLLVIYALSNYLTMKLNPATDPQQAQTQKTTSVMMTFMLFFMFMKYQWSAAFIFYWLILNFISAFQQYNYIYKPNKLKAAAGESNIITSSDRGSGGALADARPLTPVPGGAGARPRPKPRKRK